MERYSTVVTPASSYDLISLQSYKDDWGITGTESDGLFGRKIEAMSLWFAQECNRVFPVETVRDIFFFGETPPSVAVSDDRKGLKLSRRPVQTIVSVTVDGTVLQAEQYLLAKDDGLLVMLGDSGLPIYWNCLKVVVEFTAGFPAIPADVQDAVSRLVSNRIDVTDASYGIKSRYIDGVERVEYFEPSTFSVVDVDVQAAISKYRCFSVV